MNKRRLTPEWLVERLARGELGDVEATALRKRLADEGGEARLQAIAASDREILANLPAPMVAAEVRRRAAALPARRSPAWFVLAVAAPAAVALALVAGRETLRPMPVGQNAPAGEGEDGYIGIKGEPRLTVHRRRGQDADLLSDGAKVRPGDVLQLGYLPGDRQWRHGVVVSIDGRGTVTRHLPAAAGAMAAKLAERPGPLPSSYELDDAPAFERFFLVVASDPFPVDVVAAAAAAVARGADPRHDRLPLRPSFAQYSLSLEKVNR